MASEPHQVKTAEWRVSVGQCGDTRFRIEEIDAETGDHGRWIGEVYDGRFAEGEAQFVARAVNAHEELVGAASGVLADLEHYANSHGPGPDKRLARLRAALAKAEGR